jgi:HlyD family secretion protein
MALGGRPWRALLAGGRRAPWINGGLAVLLVVAVVLAFTVIGNPSAPPVPVRTAVVTRGDVTATVTGSGNAASQLSTPVSFATDGTVTAVNVKPGDTVTVGQVLATVDPAAAQEGLRTAQAALDGARAAYDQAAAGPTEVKKQQDQQAITAAQQGVDNANAAVQNARDQLALDTTSLATNVSNARTQLANDRASTATNVKTAQVQLSTDSTAQNTAVTNARTNASAACGPVLAAYAVPLTTAPSTTAPSAGGAATVTTAPTTSRTTTVTSQPTSQPTTSQPTTSRPTTSTATTAPTTTPLTGTTGGTTTGPTTTAAGTASSCTSAKQALTTAENNRSAVLQKDQLAVTSAEQARDATLDKDQQAIVAAQQTQADTLLKDNQAIATNQQAVGTAQNQVKDAQLTAEADLHPETPAQIEQARANVDSAQVQVDTARRTLDGTVLKAPLAGVVLAVNGKVGESSNGNGQSGSTSTGTNSGTNTGGATGNASSAAAASATSAGNGFITIANPSQLEVTANIAEADAAGIQLGQQATVTFPATNNTATGTVTQITPQSTVTNNVVLYPITVALDTAPPGVKTGSTASLAITDGTATGVLEVPTAAITTVGTTHTVTVRRNGTDTVVPVGVGLQGATTTEITSGLAAGDVVVLPSPTTSTTPTPGAGFPRLGGGR